MSKTVYAPDGKTKFEVPDDATPAEIEELLNAHPASATTPVATTQPQPFDSRDPQLAGFAFRGSKQAPPTRVREPHDNPVDAASGAAEQLGLTPGAIKSGGPGMLPLERGREAIAAAKSGDWPTAIGRGASAALSLAGGPLGSVAVPAIENLLSDPYTERQAADAAAARGEDSQAYGHALASIVPVFGHPAAEAGELFGHGQNYRGAGRAAALVAPFAVGAGGEAVAPSEEAAAAARTTGPVRRTLSERTGSRAAELAEGFVERSLPGSMVFRKFRQNAIADVEKLANDTVARISDYKGSPESLGTHIQDSIDLGRRKAVAAADSLDREVASEAQPQLVQKTRTIKAADKQVDTGLVDESGNPLKRTERGAARTEQYSEFDRDSGAWVDYSGLKELAPEIYKAANDPYRVIPDAERSKLMNLAESIAKGQPQVPWQAAIRDREVLRKWLKPDSELTAVPGAPTQATAAQHLFGALDSAMEESLTRAGGWELADKWRAAETLRAANSEAYTRGILARLQGRNPEAVPDLLRARSTGLEDIRVVKQYVGPQLFDASIAKVMQDILGESTRAQRGATGVQYLNPQMLANKIESLARSGKLSEMVSPETEAQLKLLVDESRKTQLPRGLDWNVLHFGNLAGAEALFKATKAVLMHGIGGVPTALAMAGGYGSMALVAKLLTEPAGVMAIRQALATAARTGSAVGEAQAGASRPDSKKQPAPVASTAKTLAATFGQ